MHIEALRIERYGPLKEFSETDIGGFSLIRGPNEEGKTLLIDALLRLLFRKRTSWIKAFGNMARVKEPPEGYVVVDVDGEEIKIERNDSLANHVDIAPTDFRNIFVVRDSDLSIRDQGDYFTVVSEKLAGLRTSEIDKIRKKLQEKGRLTNPTSSADLANNVESGHIRRQIETAKALIGDIKALADELDAGGFESLEQVLAGKRQQLRRERGELDLHRDAKLRAECVDNADRIEELKRVRQQHRGLSAINDEDFETWTHGVRDLERLREELGDARREYNQCQTQLGELEESAADKEAVVEGMRDRQRRIEDLLEPKIFAYREIRRGHPRRESRRGLLRWSIGIASAGLLISLAGAVLQPTVFFFAASGAFAVMTFVGALLQYRVGAAGAELAQRFAVLKTQAAGLGFQMSSLEELLRERAAFESSLDDARRAVESVRVALGTHKKQLEKTGQQIRDIRQQIDDIERTITDVKTRSGVPDIAGYQTKVRAKNDQANQQRVLEATLVQALGAAGEGPKIEFWEEKLAQRLNSLIEDNPVTYDTACERDLNDSIQGLEQTVAQTEEALKSGRQALHDLESKIRHSGIAGPEDIVCRTSGELRLLEQQLGEFVNAVLEKRDDARAALTILEDIEVEERNRVIELFGKDKPVSEYFRLITDGRYVEVAFDPGDAQLNVRAKEDGWVSANKLSGGALDQLYLAIRLSIAESLCGEGKGFFILDDPFIKSDIVRLKSQLRLLRRIVDSGWQVLYFSAKQEVYDLVGPEIAAGRVRLIELDAAPLSAARTPAAPSSPAPPADLFSNGPTY